MTISFFLVDPSRESSSIRVVVSHRGKYYRKAVGIVTSHWSQETQRTGEPALDRQLKLIRRGLEAAIDERSTDKEVKEALSRVSGGKWLSAPLEDYNAPKTPDFWEFFQSIANNAATKRTRDARMVVARKFKKLWPEPLTWDSFTPAFFDELSSRMDAAGMAANTQMNFCRVVKTCLISAEKKKYITDRSFREWVRRGELPTTIYLTAEEMERLWVYDYADPQLAACRDMAWLAYLTCARWSDYSRLSEDMIVGGRIYFHQVKTGGSVIVPCSPRVREILSRHGGCAPKMYYKRFVRDIREAARLAGIDTPTEKVITKGGRKVRSVLPKYELITSHTFRRSGATNLYLLGVPSREIMFITGHRSEVAFARYIRITQEEAADKLAENPFFK